MARLNQERRALGGRRNDGNQESGESLGAGSHKGRVMVILGGFRRAMRRDKLSGGASAPPPRHQPAPGSLFHPSLSSACRALWPEPTPGFFLDCFLFPSFPGLLPTPALPSSLFTPLQRTLIRQRLGFEMVSFQNHPQPLPWTPPWSWVTGPCWGSFLWVWILAPGQSHGGFQSGDSPVLAGTSPRTSSLGPLGVPKPYCCPLAWGTESAKAVFNTSLLPLQGTLLFILKTHIRVYLVPGAVLD